MIIFLFKERKTSTENRGGSQNWQVDDCRIGSWNIPPPQWKATSGCHRRSSCGLRVLQVHSLRADSLLADQGDWPVLFLWLPRWPGTMNPPCARCNKTVYPMEKLSCLDKVRRNPFMILMLLYSKCFPVLGRLVASLECRFQHFLSSKTFSRLLFW